MKGEIMDCNVNFKGRLIINGMTKDKNRWAAIAKRFKEETKGINYESRIFDDKGKLEIYTDRLNRKNRRYDCIDDLTSREAFLTEKGTEELLSQSDDVIARILAQHLKFVKKLDENFKQADVMINDLLEKVSRTFKRNGFDTKNISDVFNSDSPNYLAQVKVAPEYDALKKLPGFKDAEMSHIYL